MIRLLALAAVATLGLGAAMVVSGATTASSSCELSVSEALLSNRIVGASQSYRKDNPNEYLLVRAYLDGGARPSTTGMSHMGLHLVYLEDTCRDAGTTTSTTTTTTTTTTQPPPPPPPPGSSFYVSTSGSDTASGSQSAPWRTIKKACDTVTAGTINVAAGTYVESGTCLLKNGVSLDGAGIDQTIVRSGALDSQVLVQNTTSAQTVSDLTLDGQARTTALFGLKVRSTANLTVTRIKAQGFKNLTNFAGSAVDVVGATDFEFSFSTLLNSGGAGSGYCNGTLGLGGLLRAKIHDLTVSTDQGYAVKAAGSSPTTVTDSEIYNSDFKVTSSNCSSWSTLTVELWQTIASNSRFHHNNFDGIVSLTGPQINPSIGNPRDDGGYRWRLDHNRWTINTGSRYSVEMSNNSMEVDHNYVSGGIYPWSYFESQTLHDDWIHHNVSDNTQNPIAFSHFASGLTGSMYEKNTVVLRLAYSIGVVNFGPGSSGNTLRDNIFYATLQIGDKLNAGSSTVDHNSFWNLTAKGTNAITANPGLSLSGGFPNAYTPSTSSGVGAFADGTFSVGPQ